MMCIINIAIISIISTSIIRFTMNMLRQLYLIKAVPQEYGLFVGGTDSRRIVNVQKVAAFPEI